MEMTGQYRIPAPRQAVWEALNDPEILKACIPGCQSLERGEEENTLVAKVTQKIGPVKATFNGKVKLENLNPPEGYTISGEGSGGVAGFAKGGADVSLTEDGADTILDYTARAQVGGKLAQLGSRLIDATAKKLADQFFAAFVEKVGTPGETAAGASETDAGSAPSGFAEAVPPTADPAPARPAVPPEDPLKGETPIAAPPEVEPSDRAASAKQEEANPFVRAEHEVEGRVDAAAARSGPSGPMMWALIALAVLIVILIIASV